MKNKLNKYVLLLLPFLFLGTFLKGQGWERIYFPPGGVADYSYAAANQVFLQDDGSYLFAASVENEPKFLFTDSDGIITNLVDVPFGGGGIIRSTDDNFVYGARLGGSPPPEEDVLIRKFDIGGNVLWTYRPPGYLFGNETVTDLLQSTDGDYVYVGAQGSTSNGDVHPYIAKISETGNVLWKTVGPTLPENNIYDYSVLETADGGFFSVASSNWFTVNNPIITNARKVDVNGNVQWVSGLDTDIQVKHAVNAADGNIVLLGRNMDYDYVLLKIDGTGSSVWQQVLPAADYPFGYTTSLILTSDNGFAFLGNTQDGDEDIYLIKTDENGNVQWQQSYGGAFGDNGLDMKQTPDGGYIIAGGANRIGEDQSLYIIKTDELGSSLANFIYGQVKYDLDEDCIATAAEQGLENWIIAAAGSTGTFYAAADADGQYRIEVTPDDYEVTLTLANDYWTACTNDVMVTVVDSSEVDFAVQSIEQCPLMEVQVNNYGFRLCEQSTINVFCANQGTELAEDVYVEVTLADSLTLLSATVPYTLIGGNTYSFEVGDMDFLTSTTFSIAVQVGCSIELMGQSLCVEALIFPDTSCLPIDPLWSGASIQLSATCNGDEVELKIENVGEAAMLEALQYTVIEDHVIMLQGQPYGPLAPGESVVIPRVADGSFYRIESPQVANHPGMSMPSAFIEGCGTGENGEISLGYVNQYPIDDEDYFVALTCTEVLAAYDPNIKQAYPIGYDVDHFVKPNTDIDYVIKFQNTGTAQANQVVIVDRLSANLDPATIKPGNSSHPYDFELLGEGIARFTFNNIALPDSTTNEPASHGYVKFSIEQQKDLPIDTRIENSAAIYFDFNPAIITNTTFHTIGDGFIMVEVGEVLSPLAAVKAYPNPFTTMTTLEVVGEDLGLLEFVLFDATGKVVRKEQFTGSKHQLDRKNLLGGIYFYQISDNKGVLNTGKLIVH